MLNPIQRYFPKLHRLFSPEDSDLVSQSLEQLIEEQPILEQLIPEQPMPEQLASEHGKKAEVLPLALLTLAVPELLSQGRALLHQEQIQETIAYYRRAVHLDPTSGEACQHLAEALSQYGELEESAAYYRRAIELSIAENADSAIELATENEFPEAALPHTISQEIQPPEEEDLPWFEEAAFHLQQGEVLCHQQDWTSAATSGNQAIALLEPQLASAYITAGWAWQEQGNLEAAEQAYKKAIAIQSSAVAYARLGSLYAQQQHFSDSARAYQEAIALDPKFAGAYWKLAQVWQQMDEPENAAICAYQALQLQPTWATSQDYIKLGQHLCRYKKLDWGVACYRQAIHLDASADAYYGLGGALGQQGDWGNAVKAYRQATLKDPQNPQFYTELGQALMAIERYEEAILCYQKIMQLAPTQIPMQIMGYQGLRDTWVKLGNWLEALPCYQALAELQPNSSMAQHEWGDALNRLNRWSEAVSAFRRAIALNPDFSWSYNNLGDALNHLGEWSEASAAFQEAIALNPNFHWSHYNLGDALVKLRQWEGAIAAYRNALQLDSNLPSIQQKLGDTLRQRAKEDLDLALDFYYEAIQRDPEDIKNYHKALDVQPNDAKLYEQLADTLTKQGQADGATVFYQIAQQLQSGNAKILPHDSPLKEKNGLLKQPLQTVFGISTDLYDYWLKKNTPTSDDLHRMSQAVLLLKYQPLISIIMPTYNTPEQFLKEAIQSVLNQVYPHWELCIADDASTQPHIRRMLKEYAMQDTRIKVVVRACNGHISAASNSALALATGKFIALLDHDDIITPNALYEVALLLNQHPEADMIYSDEDKLNERGQRTNPFFKPDWCPDSFLTRMYTCHMGIYRRSLVEQLGGFRVGYEGSQDYDLVLRVTELTDKIFHIPKILYHWRINATSVASSSDAKPYAYKAAVKAIGEALDRRNEGGRIIANPKYPGTYTVRYQITDYKLVSIIIPTKNLGDVLNNCLTSIFSKSTYPHYEVILIDNGSEESETANVIAAWKQREPDRFNCYPLNVPFNYSRINNYAVTRAKGDYLLFLNNDTEVITLDWIEGMVEQAQRSSIGAVGTLLLYPDKTIQHAGVVLGIGGVAGHSHKHFPLEHPGYFNQVLLTSNYSAVTAACLMCRREVFEAVGGFDEQLTVAFNDTDLCLKLIQQGFRNIYLSHVTLYHHESKSRGYEDTPEKICRFEQESARMKQRWGELLQGDPCYSPNLTKEREDFSLPLPPVDTKVVEISYPSLPQSVLAYAIDSPKLDWEVSSFYLSIAGWILGKRCRAVEVQLLYNGQVFHTIPVTHPRPDVVKIYPEAIADSGFVGAIAINRMPSSLNLILRAVFEDKSYDSLGTITLQEL